MTEPKKLYRDTDNKMIAGVCAGFAKYIDADPTVIRLVTVLVSIMLGFFGGVILYIVAVIIIPEKPKSNRSVDKGN